jgi:hypothetical protein
MRRPICVLVIAIAMILPSTQSVRAQDAVKGLRYWLPIDVAILDVVVVTTKTTEYVVTEPGAEGKLVKRTTTEVTREGQLATKTLADHTVATAFSLDAVAGKLADTGLAVQVSSAGLLQSVNPTSKGRGPELLTSIAKFIGTAASALLGNPLSIGGLSPSSKLHLSEMFNAMVKRHATGDLKMAMPLDKAPQACDAFAAPISTQPIRVRALLVNIEPACVIFWRIQDRLDALDDFQTQRLQLEGQLETTKPEQLPDLRQKIADRTKAINATNAELAALQARLMALLEAFVSDQGLGVKTTTERFSTTLQLADLKAKLDQLPDLQKAFYKSTGVAVLAEKLGSVDQPTNSNVGGPTTPPATESKQEKKEREKREKDAAAAAAKAVSIYFRQARPWRLEVRSSRCSLLEPTSNDGLSAPCRKDDNPATPTPSNTELKTAVVVDLIAGDTQTSSLSFTTAAFSDKGLSVAFDDKGRPTQMQRTGGSSLAGLATAIAGAASTMRDEYASGLAKIVEIQSSRQKIALADVNADIARLQKEKDLIDAKLAASSAGQSFDLLLEQNQLNAELSLLKTKLESQKPEDILEQRLEIEKMRLELEKVKAELDLVKAKQELKEATTPKPGGN